MSDSLANPWSVAHQTPLSMGFPSQENWNGLPIPSPGDLPNPGIRSGSPTLASGFFSTELPGKPKYVYMKLHVFSNLCFPPIFSPTNFYTLQKIRKRNVSCTLIILMFIYHKTGDSLFYVFPLNPLSKKQGERKTTPKIIYSV